jgi:hypothetical protein
MTMLDTPYLAVGVGFGGIGYSPKFDDPPALASATMTKPRSPGNPGAGLMVIWGLR